VMICCASPLGEGFSFHFLPAGFLPRFTFRSKVGIRYYEN
jgi:hypothetical protein